MRPHPTSPTHRVTSRATRRAAVLASLVAAGALASCSSDGAAGSTSSVAPTTSQRPASSADDPTATPVILDYSPTVSDAGALLYLAASNAVDLVGVTLPGTGEADCGPGTRTTRALLELAGAAEVPVGCGRDTPLVGARDWPAEWRAEANTWGDGILPPTSDAPVDDAERLLADLVRASAEPVTIVAVGPLTNLGVVLADHPELAPRIERIVIMGGAVHVPGNVDAAPAAEWNLYVDPEAARRVLASGIEIVLVPLDATNEVPWSERVVLRLGALDGPIARAEHDMVSTRASLDGVYLWDELAAVATLRPELLTFEDVSVSITDDGATSPDPDGTAVRVAVDADAPAVLEDFMRTLNGGTLPEVPEPSTADMVYLVDMGSAASRFGRDVGAAFTSLGAEPADPVAAAHAFVDTLFGAVDALARDVRGTTPPAAVAADHKTYARALDAISARRDEVTASIASGTESGAGVGSEDARDISALIDAAFRAASMDAAIAEMQRTCTVLQDWSFLRDGPRLCQQDGE